MTPTDPARAAQAAEWRWWRKQNPAGARRAWRADRDWIRGTLRKSETASRLGELLIRSHKVDIEVG